MECRVGGNLTRIQNRRVREAMDTLKGAALIAAFLGFIATCATWIHIWDSTWQAAVEPVRGAIYKLNSIALAFAVPSLIMDMVALSGVSFDIIAPGRRGDLNGRSFGTSALLGIFWLGYRVAHFGSGSGFQK